VSHPSLRKGLIPVYFGHPSKSEPVGFVSFARAQELVDRRLARSRYRGMALQMRTDTHRPSAAKSSPESRRIIEIAQFQQKSCQGGLINPR
jgi:hypothetical protein